MNALAHNGILSKNQHSEGLRIVPFDNKPLEDWLTAKQIAKRAPDTSMRRVQEVLAELRDSFADTDEKPFRQFGRAFLYHPDFVDLVNNRKKTTGVEPKNS